jgi:threonylcarbamoyladenosine tRNA methylthiotransferase MtaB
VPSSSPQAGRERLFTFACLGCKVNQAEAAWLTGRLTGLGWREAGPGEAVQAAILLTCTVTGSAGRQSRQMARRLLRRHPGAKVVVSGCDAQAASKSYDLPGLTWLPRARLADLPELLSGDQAWPAPAPPPPPESGPWCPGSRPPGQSRTRGLLKVQDGCDAGCAYCLVPLARGAPRSLPLDQACQALADLGIAGAAEVVLTGVHLGRYGNDLPDRPDLTRLLAALLAAHPGPRLRLSSLEVGEVSERLLALMADEPRLCPHLHLPLQTGSDQLLQTMGRTYQAADYAAVVEKAVRALPGLCLGADVMVGLPGETEQDFAATHELLASLPISYLHVFPYSPRPGTRAAAMPDRVPPALARERAALLRRLGEDKRLAFLQAQVGRRLSAVVEASGLGRADNYCLVALPRELPPGTRVEVLVDELKSSRQGPLLQGRLLREPA